MYATSKVLNLARFEMVKVVIRESCRISIAYIGLLC